MKPSICAIDDYDEGLLPVTPHIRRVLRFKEAVRHILSEQVPRHLHESNT